MDRELYSCVLKSLPFGAAQPMPAIKDVEAKIETDTETDKNELEIRPPVESARGVA
jgi:hypothetical protein